MSDFSDELDAVAAKIDRTLTGDITARSKGQAYPSSLPPIGKGVFDAPESEEQLVGSGKASFVPMDYSWEDAIRIAAGELEGPRPGPSLLQRARAAITGEKLPEQDIVTPGYRLKSIVAPILALGKNVRRAQETDTVIDEAGNVVTRSSFKRGTPQPPPTLEEQSAPAAELAGMGTLFSQFSRYGVPGTSLLKKADDFLGEKFGHKPTQDQVIKFINAWKVANEKAIAEGEKFKTPINRWAIQRQAEQEAEAAKVALQQSNAAAEAAVEAEANQRLKTRLANEPVPPGPRNVWPRVEDAPPGESSPWPRRQLTEGTEPKRVIEAPPKTPGSLESAVQRSMIREEQGQVLGEVDPTGPHPRVIMEPGYRDPDTGRWIPPRPRMVDVPGETPGPLPGKPTILDRIRGREEAVVGRGQGWMQDPEGNLILIDDLGNVNAKIVPVINKDRTWFELQTGEGKHIKSYDTAKEAAADAAKKFPGKVRKPPEPPAVKPPEPPTAPPSPTPTPPPVAPGGRPVVVAEPPPTPTTRMAASPAISAAASEAEAAGRLPGPSGGPVIEDAALARQNADLRNTFSVAPSPAEPYAHIDNALLRKYTQLYNGVREKYRKGVMTAKSFFKINSMSSITKDYPIMQDLLAMTDEAKAAMDAKADNATKAYRDLIKEVGDKKEVTRLLKLRDERQPLGTSSRIEAKVNTFYNMAEDMTGDLPGNPVFKDGFVKRLKQSQMIQDGEVIDKEYTTEDLRRINPPEKGKKLKARLAKETLEGDEAYSPENVVRTLRALGRKSVLGTKISPGYMEQIKPIMAEIRKLPEIVRAEATDMVNHFLGTPGSRDAQALQRWADRHRAYQFGSKIVGNLTSPVSNAGQNFLTYAETGAKPFTKAWLDIIDDWNARATGAERNPEFVKWLKDANMENQLASSSVMSDIGILPTDLLNKWDRTQSWINDKGGIPFRFVEEHNRLAAARSGYHKGVDDLGLSHEDAIKYGRGVLRKTQFPGQADLPRAFRSAFGSAAGQFKTFTVKYTEYMIENGADAIKSFVDPNMTMAERKHNIAKFARFWGSQVGMGGLGVIPGAEFLFGDQLQEQPEWVQHGLGGLIGLDLGRQFGIGVIPVQRIGDLLYNIPGPTANAIQDAASVASGMYLGDGFDIDQNRLGKPLTWDEWERKAVRLLPGGVQGARFIEAIKTIRSQGERHKSLTLPEALGMEDATGHKLYETTVSVMDEVLGNREIAREREIDIGRKARTDEEIARRARVDAAEYYTAGKFKEAEATLEQAGKKLGYPIFLGEHNVAAGAEARIQTALERMRTRVSRHGIVIPKP